MRTTIRLLLKTYRFELIAITLVCLFLTGTELYLTTQLNALALPKECQFDQNISVDQGFGTQPPGQALADSCQAKQSAFYEADQHAAEIMGVGAAVPVLAGILIGVAVVGRELESGTVSLAWTLSRSRRRWYLTRALLIGAILGGVLLVPATAANLLEHSRQPLVDSGSSFADDGLRGPVIVMLGLQTYALAVVAGAIVGRQLPAVIMGLALTVAAILAFENGATRWQASLAEWRPAASSRYSIDIILDQGYRDRTTGSIVDQNSVFNAAPQVDGGPDGTWIDAHYDSVALIVPGSRYGLIVAGESAVLGGAALVLLGLGLLVVNRRRPD
jgi:ABC-type transport system involved in multi-copper enzyme maturation permease subunit